MPWLLGTPVSGSIVDAARAERVVTSVVSAITAVTNATTIASTAAWAAPATVNPPASAAPATAWCSTICPNEENRPIRIAVTVRSSATAIGPDAPPSVASETPAAADTTKPTSSVDRGESVRTRARNAIDGHGSGRHHRGGHRIDGAQQRSERPGHQRHEGDDPHHRQGAEQLERSTQCEPGADLREHPVGDHR